MAEKNADIFAKYGLSSPQSSPKSPGGDVFAKYGLSAPAPKERSIIDEIKSVITGDYPEAQPRSRDEFARDVIDGVGDGIARVAKPIGDYVVKPVFGALDYVDAPVRQATKVYQDQPESLQFSPKGLIQPVMSGAKFAFDELRGRKTPADAPSFDELYKRTDIGRTLNNPAIAGPTGKFLLNAPGPDIPEEYDINAKELMGRDYDATSLEVGRKANELVGGGLLQAAMPSNLLLSAAPKALEKAKLARDAFKAAGREALAAEKAEQAVAPQIRRAGIVDDVPPGPPKPEAPITNTPPAQLEVPESAEALAKYIEQARGAGYNTDLPQGAALERASQMLPDLKHPIIPAQRNATKDILSRDKYRALKDSGTDTAKQLAEYEQLQRAEAINKIDETINQASPTGTANPDRIAQAETLQKQFVESYEARKKELGQAFNEYDNVKVDPIEHVPQLTEKIAQEIPGFEKFIESVSDEGVKLRPYSKKMGVSRREYDAIAEVVSELGSGPVTVKELRNIRGALLRDFPNPLDRPPVVNQLRKAMLNHLQDIVARRNPARRNEIFKTFQDYAINEKNLDELEKVFGGSFSEIAAGTSKGVTSERVLDRIFANSTNAAVAKNAMGEAAFNEAFASYLAQKKLAFTNQEGAFSSRRFGNWLNTKRDVFQQAGVNPNTLERLDALTTVLRLTADAPPINPSGTAKTTGLLKTIWNNVEAPSPTPSGILGSAKKAIVGTVGDVKRQRGAARTFDELSGVETKGLLEKAGEKLVSPETRALTRKMKKAAKAKADELGKTAKDFIDDEEGKFSPEDLLNILKPGQENVFDLKKARGLVGEPKRGLLEPKDNPVAKYRPPLSREERADLLNWIDSAYDSLRRGEKFKPVDEQYLREVLPVAPDYQKKYVKDLLATIEKQKVGGAEEIARSMGGRAEIPGVKTPAGPHNVKQGDTLYRASNPDGGELRVLEYDPTTDNYLVSDGLGKSWRKSDELVASKDAGKGLLTSLDVERGPVTERPEAADVKFFESPSVEPNPWNSTGQIFKGKSGPLAGQEFTVLPVTKEVRRDGDLLMEVRLKDGSIKQMTKDEIFWSMRPDTDPYGRFASPEALADQQKRLKEIGADMKRRNSEMKAAEAERMKKGLIGVDFGGRGGKMPKAMPSEPPTTEQIWKAFDDAGVKPKPIYEKNGVKIYTKDSNSFGDQIIHYSIGDGPRKTETFGEGSHMDFDTFADIYGPKKKPKGGKGKPKKKKD